MFILNRYDVTAPVAPAAAAVDNAAPSVITGATGNSANNDMVAVITSTATYTDQIISKLVAITLNAGTLSAGANAFSYIKVPLVQLGIAGVRPVLAAQVLGVYNPASTEQVGAGATPSFIGTVAGAPTLAIYVVNSALIIKVPVANVALINGKVAMVQLFYSTAAGE